MLALLSVFCLLNLLSTAFATTASFIPLARNGYSFHRGNFSSLTTVEYFLDLTCPTCKEGWPILGEVYEQYKNKVHFEYRVYPLPHHAQSFLTAQAAQVVNKFGSNSEAVFTYFNTAFEKQSAIVGTTTNALSYNEVVDLVSEWAIINTGVSIEQYYEGMNTSTTVGNQCSVDSRNMWKYCAIQGMFQTPLYRVDGLLVSGLKTVIDWQTVLDPLVSE
jgi:hypothetical protein